MIPLFSLQGRRTDHTLCKCRAPHSRFTDSGRAELARDGCIQLRKLPKNESDTVPDLVCVLDCEWAATATTTAPGRDKKKGAVSAPVSRSWEP